MKSKKPWSAVLKAPGPSRGSPGGRVDRISHGLVEIAGMRAGLLLCPVGTDELLTLRSATQQHKADGTL